MRGHKTLIDGQTEHLREQVCALDFVTVNERSEGKKKNKFEGKEKSKKIVMKIMKEGIKIVIDEQARE